MSTPPTLEDVFARQLQLQRESFGVDPAGLPLEERIDYIKEMVLAAEDELHEALQEVGWKSWSTKKFINEDALQKELVDVIHFVVNLCLAANMTAEQVLDRYFAKAAVNAKRQAEGYDNTNKCPACSRALDEPGDPT